MLVRLACAGIMSNTFELSFDLPAIEMQNFHNFDRNISYSNNFQNLLLQRNYFLGIRFRIMSQIM